MLMGNLIIGGEIIRLKNEVKKMLHMICFVIFLIRRMKNENKAEGIAQ